MLITNLEFTSQAQLSLVGQKSILAPL